MNNEAKIEVVMYLYFKRESDVDSRTKITLDLLQKAGIYKNDSQVYNLLIFKNFDKENPRVELRVSET